MNIRRIEDIEREKRDENRLKIKKEISEDINDVIGNVFGKPKRKKTWISKLFYFFKILGILFLIIIILDLVLGSVWLLKFFIKSLFF